MQSEFNQIVALLLTDPRFSITVDYPGLFDSWRPIIRNANAEQLIQLHGSVANFFEDIKAKGINSFRIQSKRPNGSKGGKQTYCNVGQPIIINMESKENIPVPPTPKPQPVAAAVQTIPAVPMLGYTPQIGMNGVGLTGEDAYRYYDHPRLVGEVNRLSAENASQKSTIDDLKDTIRENKFSNDKSSSNNELVKVLAPLLAPMAMNLVAPGAGMVPGLGHPEPQLSPIKTAFIQGIKALSDEFVNDLAKIVKLMSSNPEFDSELLLLIDKHSTQNNGTQNTQPDNSGII